MRFFTLLLLLLVASCQTQEGRNAVKVSTQTNSPVTKTQSALHNEKAKSHTFLQCMYSDPYFPKPQVDKGRAILVNLCFDIEEQHPLTLDELYQLTHAATDEFNELQEEFEENGSEIETGARECIADDFAFIANAYGFKDADAEALISSRDW